MTSQTKIILAVVLGLALLLAENASHAQETEQEITAKSLEFTLLENEGNNQCPSAEEWERGVKETKQLVKSLLTDTPTTGQTTEQSISGQTTEQSISGQTTEQSMSTTTDPLYSCNGTPGWRQVVFINMIDTSYDCPPGLELTSYSKRTCGPTHTNSYDCSSTTFSVGGSEYNRVCGRIRGYQVGKTGSFYGYSIHSESIDGSYVDGVSLTHGPSGRRQHIWTFAGGLTEADSQYSQSLCPCDTSNAGTVSPPFVGNDYFCESGLNSRWTNCDRYCGVPFLDDPLWDGHNCTSTSTCCQFNNPPWFTKTLPNPTTDDIELRICSFARASTADSPLEIIELYVK